MACTQAHKACPAPAPPPPSVPLCTPQGRANPPRKWCVERQAVSAGDGTTLPVQTEYSGCSKGKTRRRETSKRLLFCLTWLHQNASPRLKRYKHNKLQLRQPNSLPCFPLPHTTNIRLSPSPALQLPFSFHTHGKRPTSTRDFVAAHLKEQ